MTKHTDSITDEALDALLDDIETTTVPTHFSHNLMQKIDTLPDVKPVTKPSWWQWLALVSGGIPALMQLATFIFGAWHIASVG